MPLPVCAKCSKKMALQNGVVYIEYMESTKTRVYQVWNADMAKCTDCKAEVVFRFADKPFLMHHEEDFETKLQEIKDSGRKIIGAY